MRAAIRDGKALVFPDPGEWLLQGSRLLALGFRPASPLYWVGDVDALYALIDRGWPGNRKPIDATPPGHPSRWGEIEWDSAELEPRTDSKHRRSAAVLVGVWAK